MCFVRKGVFRNFAKFTGKHLCQSLLFNKIAGLKPATLSKMRLQHRYFSADIAKILRTAFFYGISPMVGSEDQNHFTQHLQFVSCKRQMKTFRSSHQRCSMKKVFLEISQNSQVKPCAGVSFLLKLQALRLQLY